MATEKAPEKTARAVEIIRRLDAAMPDAKIELNFSTPLELVISVLLAAQTTDKGVNLATPALFAKYKTAHDYARATPEELEKYIKTLGLFRNKAKHLVKLGAALIEKHGGQVPGKRAELSELPGVGNKTAGVVAIHLGTDTGFPVDTHIMRLSKRLGFTTKTEPDDVEVALRKLLPQELWFQAHQLIIWHGRRVCDAKNPACHRCVLADVCPKKGVPKKKD
jgi:endonuclease III